MSFWLSLFSLANLWCLAATPRERPSLPAHTLLIPIIFGTIGSRCQVGKMWRAAIGGLCDTHLSNVTLSKPRDSSPHSRAVLYKHLRIWLTLRNIFYITAQQRHTHIMYTHVVQWVFIQYLPVSKTDKNSGPHGVSEYRDNKQKKQFVIYLCI